MEESTLVKTFEMLIDQLGTMAKKVELIQENMIHTARHQTNNKIICGRLFGFDFDIKNFCWDPSHNTGHIQLSFKDSAWNLSSIFYKIWSQVGYAGLDATQQAMADDIKEFTKSVVPDYDDFARKLGDNQIAEPNIRTESYGIESIYHDIDDYIVMSYIKTKVKGDFIRSCNLTPCHASIIFVGMGFSDYACDRVIKYIFDQFDCIGIKPHMIDMVNLTGLNGHMVKIAEIYDAINPNEYVREREVDRYIEGLCPSAKRCFKHQLEDARECVLLDNEVFNSDHEFDKVMSKLN